MNSKPFMSNQVKSRFIMRQGDIAGQIYEIMEREEITQEDLIESVDIGKEKLLHILSGHADPTLKDFIKLEVALGDKVIAVPKYQDRNSVI